MTYPPGPPGSSGPPYGAPAGAPSSEDRTWALIAHIGCLVSAWFALGLLCPLLILLFKSGSPFVRRHAVESLNFQITLLILIVVATAVSIVTLGLGLIIVIPVGVVVAILALIFLIQGTAWASRGEDYRYPINIRLVS